MSTLIVIYDGQCPFCRRYVDLVRLREKRVNVVVHDARLDATRRQFPDAYQYDLNRGMLVMWHERWHHADEAMHLISNIIDQAPGGTVMMHRIPAKFLYPVLRTLRSATLKMLGRTSI